MSNEYTHDDFKAMKKALKLTNADIAKIIGLTTNSVKTLSQPSAELPSWAKAMLYVWKELKSQ